MDSIFTQRDSVALQSVVQWTR